MHTNHGNPMLVPSSKGKPVISFRTWSIHTKAEEYADGDHSGDSEDDLPAGYDARKYESGNPRIRPLIRVLHVEDDQQLCLITRFLLTNVCTVDSAADPEDAYQKLQRNTYDLVLMDLDLGSGLDGLRLSRKLRSIPAYQHLPILALTANTDPVVKAKCRRAGINDYIEKPFLKNDIITAIEELIRKDS